ncbi:MAG: hypothetical protein AB8B52_02420 [Winogradskyella sp.]|uniref:hypothetical protein n=1 Tax=Winogradskyella sp. TaxID=1883156 RepID=UPI00385BFA03
MKKLIFIILVTIIGFCFIGRNKEAKLTIINTTPYEVKLAYACEINNEILGVKGWYFLKPGEHLEFNHDYNFMRPEFFVHAQSNAPKLIRWIYDLKDEHEGKMYFDGDDKALFLKVYEDGFSYTIKKDEIIENEKNDGSELSGFVVVESNSESESTHVIYDNEFSEFINLRGINEIKQIIDSISSFSKVLSNSIQAQFEFNKMFPEPAQDFPFHLGLELEDMNGYNQPGIEIKNVIHKFSIDGGSVPLKKHDLITALNGAPIFSFGDLYYHLWLHGNSLNKGIEFPLEVLVQRNDSILLLKTSYYFNQDYFGVMKNEEQKALLYGAGETFFYGKAAEAIGIIKTGFIKVYNKIIKEHKFNEIDYNKERWLYAQNEMRHKQFYSNQFSIGGISTMFFSPAQIFSKTGARQLYKTGLSRKSSNVLSTFGIELAEGIVWTYNTTSSISTQEDKLNRLKQDLPIIVGVGILSGSLSRNTKLKY